MLVGIVVLTVASFAVEAAVNTLLLRAFPEALAGPQALAANLWVRALTFAYGLTCVAAGGYVAARLARRLPVHHAAAMGILQAGLTMLAMLSPVGNHASRWVWIVTAILTIPAAVAGGVAGKGRKSTGRVENAAVSA